MKLAYKNSFLTMHMVIALLFIIILVIQMIVNNKIGWSNLIYFLFAALYTIQYLRQRKKGYLFIENGICKQYTFLSFRKIDLEKVDKIKYFSNNYILISDTEELTINEKFLDSKAIEQLLNVFRTYGLAIED